jgi:uncharacterized membrane protein YcaP (DUF421 family)
MWFDTWYALVRVVVASLVAYAALVGFLRISGKRTLAKLNAFDLVVTVALGSTLANIALSPDVAIVEGILALGMFVVLQFVVAWLSVRAAPVQRLLKSQPVVVVRDGRLLEEVLVAHRLSTSDVHQAIRSSGLGDPELAGAVVLESDGTLSVVPAEKIGSGRSLVKSDWEHTGGADITATS